MTSAIGPPDATRRVDVIADAPMLAHIRGREQQPASVGAGQQLAVEQIAVDRFVQRDFGFIDDDRREAGPHCLFE